MKLKLVGADSGAYERATFVDSVILGPSGGRLSMY